jgi:hypothetical protein
MGKKGKQKAGKKGPKRVRDRGDRFGKIQQQQAKGEAWGSDSNEEEIDEEAEGWTGNHYKGFVVPNSEWRPEVVDSASLTPELFFERFVKTRTPVVIDGCSGLGNWRGMVPVTLLLLSRMQ